MKSIFEDLAYREVIKRIDRLSNDSAAHWGKMNVSQIIWHCKGPLSIMLQKKDYGLKPNWLAKVFFKQFLYNDKPWIKGLPTAKFLKTKDNKDFTSEMIKLKLLIDEAYALKASTEWNPHPGFGYFTAHNGDKCSTNI